jgi:hypothetical protein
MNGAEAEHHCGGNNGQRAEHDLGDIFSAGTLELAEEQAAPQDPARIAMGMRCLFKARSTKTWRVPLSRVGTVQRAVNTPATMQREMAKGDRPELTSLVGASAAPSHAPAPSPQSTPRPWVEPKLEAALVFGCGLIESGLSFRAACVAVHAGLLHELRAVLMQDDEQREADAEDDEGNEEVTVGEDCTGF